MRRHELTGVLRRVHERRLGFLAELLTRDPRQQAYTEAQIAAVERLLLRP